LGRRGPSPPLAEGIGVATGRVKDSPPNHRQHRRATGMLHCTTDWNCSNQPLRDAGETIHRTSQPTRPTRRERRLNLLTIRDQGPPRQHAIWAFRDAGWGLGSSCSWLEPCAARFEVRGAGALERGIYDASFGRDGGIFP
jgi:hypothetical protein